jgi:hypothetical protein
MERRKLKAEYLCGFGTLATQSWTDHDLPAIYEYLSAILCFAGPLPARCTTTTTVGDAGIWSGVSPMPLGVNGETFIRYREVHARKSKAAGAVAAMPIAARICRSQSTQLSQLLLESPGRGRSCRRRMTASSG